MVDVSIHNVESIKLSKVKKFVVEDENRFFYSRDLKIVDNKNHTTKIILFSDERKNLKIENN